MPCGAVVGTVVDNRDPEGMNRVKVCFPVDNVATSVWCRVSSPMAGAGRGLVMLPDVGTEVALMYATRSQSPYVLGAVYNGAGDRPEPYHNDDEANHRRVLWSRNDHLLVFDDTPGAEQMGLGACAATRLQVSSAPIHHVLNAASKTVSEHSEGSTFHQAVGKYSVTCTTFHLKANRVLVQAGGTIGLSAQCIDVTSGNVARCTSPDTHIKTGACPPLPEPADPAAAASHPPTRS